MDTTEQLELKYIKDYKETLTENLKKIVTSTYLNKLFSKSQLSIENATLGLLFLNEVPQINDSYLEITMESKRYKVFQQLASPSTFWDKSRYPLLEYIFGKEQAPWVKKAWERIPTLMYQRRSNRRSFRGSKGFEQVYFVKQLNFIIDIIGENNYDLSLSERAINSNTQAKRYWNNHTEADVNKNKTLPHGLSKGTVSSFRVF